MRTMRPIRVIGAALVAVLVLVQVGPAAQATLPRQLTDKEFWSLIGQLSEADGFFRSNSGSPDNLLSNEREVSTVAARLGSQVKPGGVFLGVGPEQNFSYIAAMKPGIAFIADIRRGNLQLHLLYKALFEMSAGRADFVSRLFSRKRPAGLTASSSAAEVMNAHLQADPVDAAGFTANLKAVIDHLTTTRTIPLNEEDRAGIEYVYRNFYRFGPAINYTSSINSAVGGSGTYASIVSSIDSATGRERTFLASEENFGLIKALESRNLIVPIVGNFAGPKALRAVGAYLRERGATVTAFYVSNVESYLERTGVWNAFCLNVASLPVNENSVFIRPGGRANSLLPIAADTARCR